MKKTLKVLTLVVILSLSMVFCALAAEEPIKVAINDNYIDFTDAAPIAMDGRTMVPVRAIFEALNAEVRYHPITGEITATFPDGSVMTLTIDSDKLVVAPVDGEPVATVMDVAPWIDTAASRTYIPARFVAEATGLAVDWDGTNRIVHVTDYAALAAEFDKNFTLLNEVNAISGKLPAGKNMYMDVNMYMDMEDTVVDFSGGMKFNETAFSAAFDLNTNVPGVENLSITAAADLKSNTLYLELTDIAPLLGLTAPATGDLWGTLDLGLLIDPALLEMDAAKVGTSVGEIFETALSMGYTAELGMSPTTYARLLNDLMVAFYGDDVATKTTANGATTYKFDADLSAMNKFMEALMGESMPAELTYSGKLNVQYIVRNNELADMTMSMNMTLPGDTFWMKIVGGLTTDKVTMPNVKNPINLMDILLDISTPPMPMVPVEDTDDAAVQLTTATTYKNEFFGLNVTVPSGWWMYDQNEENMSTKSGVTGSLSNMDISMDPGYRYINFLYYANLEDSTKDNHTDFYMIAEKVDGINTLATFVEDDNSYVVGTSDDGYTFELIETKENYTIGSNKGTLRWFEVTHDDYTTYYVVKYTTALKDGYFFTVEGSFYAVNKEDGFAMFEQQMKNNIKVS